MNDQLSFWPLSRKRELTGGKQSVRTRKYVEEIMEALYSVAESVPEVLALTETLNRATESGRLYVDAKVAARLGVIASTKGKMLKNALLVDSSGKVIA